MKKKLSHFATAGVALCALTSNALAQDFAGPQPKSLGQALTSSVIFAALGMLLVFVAVFIFDKITSRIDLQKELLGNNTAVAIVTAAVVIGVSIIVAASIM